MLLLFSPRLSLFSRLYAFVLFLGARSPGFDNSRLSILAVQHAMKLLAQEDYSLSSTLDSTAPRRQPALAYFVFWALGEFGDKMAISTAGVKEEEFGLASVLEALARCLLVNQGNQIYHSVLEKRGVHSHMRVIFFVLVRHSNPLYFCLFAVFSYQPH